MLDFGWAELFLVMAVVVFALGPKEIPGLMRGMGRLFRRFQYMKYSISRQFDEFMDAEGLNEAVNFEVRHDGSSDFDEAAEDEDVMKPLKQNQEDLK
ncbi:MAG TPA: twin-arginine translocase TatA/TatE family subunit [Alphaproteobacteria bacterium]|nr:twin-arginine translocase TatA/TatE family subunit [Alphaproteobacteria bacterium]USO05807.1 MAG: twin-arginine translocase TatA/TatE family subunit [Rhodospirillales bacterium]HOO82187.1 twin-arginine translocase TatA/TatE family subunit [Alphaproteobacteria bacterium]